MAGQDGFVGIDLGTSGIRGVVLGSHGNLVASHAQTWPGAERDPRYWVQALDQILAQLLAQVSGTHQIQALSCCGTSGTVIAVDQQMDPVVEAWLYDDPRGTEQAQQLGISKSWGLCRWLWWAQTEPELYRQSWLAHPTDILLHHLGADPHTTDHTSALKSGFDLVNYQWPDPWLREHGLDSSRFPQVVAPGCPIGRHSSGFVLVAGCTDGCAGQLAAGAVAPEQISTSLGTTLIFKGVSQSRIQTADGGVYSHLHPDQSCWLPGAASFCGGGILRHHFPGADLARLDQRAAPLVPTGQVCYPLIQAGERFPLVDPAFAGIDPPFEPGSPAFYSALLEGVAMVERLGLERLEALGVDQSGPVWVTGGGNRSQLWLRIRASVLNRPLALSRHPQPAVGSAILAAAGFWGCSVQSAATQMIQTDRQIEPDPSWAEPYEQTFQNLRTQIFKP